MPKPRAVVIRPPAPLPPHVTEDDLLHIVRSTPPDPDEPASEDDSGGLPDAHRFVLACGIKAGNYRIPCKLVYDVYKKWAREPIRYGKFFKQFARLFPSRVSNATRFYLLEKGPFGQHLENLHEETYSELPSLHGGKGEKAVYGKKQTLKEDKQRKNSATGNKPKKARAGQADQDAADPADPAEGQ